MNMIRGLPENEMSTDVAAWLLEPLRRSLADPPPRRIPSGTRSKLYRGKISVTFWTGVALTNVGGLYAGIFLALGAPWQIPATAAAVGTIGLLLLTVCAVQAYLQVRLFRWGHVTTGVLEQLVKPGPDDPKALFGVSTEVVYRFTDSLGREHRVTTMIPWSRRFFALEPGDSIGVLYLPRRPNRNILVIALV
jgi:hypothetical protein